MIEVPLTAEALLAGSELPAHHKDPFDRVILAQALMAGFHVVSPDGAFPAYGVPLIWWAEGESASSSTSVLRFPS